MVYFFPRYSSQTLLVLFPNGTCSAVFKYVFFFMSSTVGLTKLLGNPCSQTLKTTQLFCFQINYFCLQNTICMVHIAFSARTLLLKGDKTYKFVIISISLIPSIKKMIFDSTPCGNLFPKSEWLQHDFPTLKVFSNAYK